MSKMAKMVNGPKNQLFPLDFWNRVIFLQRSCNEPLGCLYTVGYFFSPTVNPNPDHGVGPCAVHGDLCPPASVRDSSAPISCQNGSLKTLGPLDLLMELESTWCGSNRSICARV